MEEERKLSARREEVERNPVLKLVKRGERGKFEVILPIFVCWAAFTTPKFDFLILI